MPSLASYYVRTSWCRTLLPTGNWGDRRRTALVSTPIVRSATPFDSDRRVKLNAFLLADNLHLSHTQLALSVMISRILFWYSFSAAALNALRVTVRSPLSFNS